jgi:hypothetical protein
VFKIFQHIQGLRRTFQVLTSVTSSVKYFLVDLKALKRLGNAERPRCYTRTTKIKLWEEPDRKLVTDDVCGGGCSFWAE